MWPKSWYLECLHWFYKKTIVLYCQGLGPQGRSEVGLVVRQAHQPEQPDTSVRGRCVLVLEHKCYRDSQQHFHGPT